ALVGVQSVAVPCTEAENVYLSPTPYVTPHCSLPLFRSDWFSAYIAPAILAWSLVPKIDPGPAYGTYVLPVKYATKYACTPLIAIGLQLLFGHRTAPPI